MLHVNNGQVDLAHLRAKLFHCHQHMRNHSVSSAVGAMLLRQNSDAIWQTSLICLSGGQIHDKRFLPNRCTSQLLAHNPPR
jgi:hypothetical protein